MPLRMNGTNQAISAYWMRRRTRAPKSRKAARSSSISSGTANLSAKKCTSSGNAMTVEPNPVRPNAV